MRIIRAKFIRKYLRFFKIVYNITDPYHIILDGNFIFHAIKYKIDIQDRLNSLLQTRDAKLHVQRSVLKELRSIGASVKTSLEFAEKYCQIIEDEHFSGSNPGQRLQSFLESLQRNRSASPGSSSSSGRHYFVATQDKDLRHLIGSRYPGVPLLYLNKVIMVMEAPSSASKHQSSETEKGKSALNEEEQQLVGIVSDPKKLEEFATQRRKEKEEKIKRTENEDVEGNDKDSEEKEGEKEGGKLNSKKRSSASSSLSTSSSSPPSSLPPSGPRFKKRSLSPNPLSRLPPSQDSNSSKKKKQSTFRRGKGGRGG